MEEGSCPLPGSDGEARWREISDRLTGAKAREDARGRG
jgi:hypothetical protein